MSTLFITLGWKRILVFINMHQLYLINPQLPNNNIVDGCGNFFPGVVIVAFIEHTLDRAWWQKEQQHWHRLIQSFSHILHRNYFKTMCTGYKQTWRNNHYLNSSRTFSVSVSQHTCAYLPRGIIERYFPLNLLANVISCLRVQPLSEKAWCAAAGGWWLTWEEAKKVEHSIYGFLMCDYESIIWAEVPVTSNFHDKYECILAQIILTYCKKNI